jgi:hypothetical protein
MLDELLKLDEALERKLFAAPEAARERYERDLVPRLEDAVALVQRRSSLAKNAIEDAIVLFREALTEPHE